MRITGALALASLVCACRETTRPFEPPVSASVVVEAVTAGLAGQTAGLQPGDELLAWRRADAKGTFLSPFDVVLVELTQSPLGGLSLRVRRQGSLLDLAVAPAEWGLEPRPALAGPALETYRAARARPEAAAGLRALAEERAHADDGLASAWLHYEAGHGLGLAGRAPDSEAELATARRQLEASPGSEALRAWLLQRVAWHRLNRDELGSAAEALEAALELANRAAPRGLLAAETLEALAGTRELEGDMQRADELWARSLEWREALAPASLPVAASLHGLARAAQRRGDGGEALRLQERALALSAKVAPVSLETARSFNNLGVALAGQGRLAEAEERFARALELRERLVPGDGRVGHTLLNLGNVAADRGNLAEAERYFGRALEIARAQRQDSLDVAVCQSSLGEVAEERGDLAAAGERYRSALGLAERVAPGGRWAALARLRLGRLQARLGDAAGARALYQAALRNERALAPGGLGRSAVEQALGELALQQGDLDGARGWLEAALRARERLAPGSFEEAESAHALGVRDRRAGRRAQARAWFTRAVGALEHQETLLGGSSLDRVRFRAKHDAVYRDYLELLLEQGEADEAFRVLDRSRSRPLVDLLEGRELLAGGLPDELGRQRRSLALREARLRERLARLAPLEDPRGAAEAGAQLHALRRERAELGVRLRAAAPQLAPFFDSVAVDPAGAPRPLGPGTLLLAYHVGPQRGHVFIVPAAGPLRVAELPLGAAELRARVQRLRLLVEREPPEGVGLAGFAELAGELYELLLGPAEAELAAARRLVVVPDGALRLLPFAALVRPAAGAPGHAWEHLAERLPVRQISSATLDAQLAAARPTRAGEARLVAFADPQPLPASSPAALGAGAPGAGLEPLPAARAEAAAVVRGWPGPSSVHAGEEATEARVYALPPGTRLLHLATHGVFDERAPLDSALALAASPAGGAEDGWLRAREILERLRLDADLVVLSACDTALGEELSGDGLLGLTFAFQYAGARSVLASLWPVHDRSTGVLMARFYEGLRAGLPRDEALRAAQAALIRGPVALPGAASGGLPALLRTLRGTAREPERFDFSHPHHWAAFELLGAAS